MIKKLAFLLVFAFFAVDAFCNEAGPKTVRIAYFQSENFQEGSQETFLDGYGYDFYQRVAQYTGWRYEYVIDTYENLYQKFLKGEVDLMAGFAFSKEREQLMGFSKMPMGREVYQFMKKEGNHTLFSNPMSMRGKRIGVQIGVMEEALRRFLADNQIPAEVVVYKNREAVDQALEKDEVEVILGENLFVKPKAGTQVFFKMGNSFYFLCVTKNRPDLLGELNKALGMLMEDDPIVTAKLYNKYIRPTAVSRTLTEQERAWLAQHDTLRIGYLKKLLPYSDALSKKEMSESLLTGDSMVVGELPTGIVADVFQEMNRHLNSKKFVLAYKGYDTYDDLVAAIAQGKQDVGFPVAGSMYWAEKSGIYESAPVIRSDASLVFKGNFNESVFRVVAINKRSKMMEFLVQDHYPRAAFRHYDTVEECLQAVQDGEASSTIIGNLRTNHLLKNRHYSNLSVKLLNIPNDKYFGVAFGNEPLLKLLNRGLTMVGDDYALNLSYKYAEKLYKPSLLDDLSGHLGAVFSISAGVVGVIFLVLIGWIRRAKKQAAKEQAQNERLSMQLDVIQTISDLYHSVFLVDLNNNSFETIHTVGFIGDVIDPYRDDAQQALNIMVGNMIVERHRFLMLKFNTIACWKDYLAERDSHSIEYEGNVMGWCRITILAARRDKDGVPTHVLYISQEINNQKKAEQELQKALVQAEEANKAKTFFLNNMSHDIRTPMNAIIGFTALATSHIDNKERLQNYLAKITISSEHLLSLINDVLDMRRIESGSVKLEETDTHLPDLLQDVQTIVQNNALRRRQKLAFEVNVQNEYIVADRLRLNQILLNLLSNAIKFTPEGGSVWLKVTEQPSDVDGQACYEFRVKDNGIGISPKFKDRIFEAFAREETSTVSGIQGTGLGMAITKNIVSMMGGSIQVLSQEGQGSEFVVSLSFKIGQPVEEKIAPERDIARFNGMKVLLAEDNPLNREIATTILSDAGFVVDVVENGKEAVDMIKSAPAHTYKLVLMDVQMPLMDGYEATQAIRKLDDPSKANVVIVAMTANAFDEDRQKAIAAGMNGHLAKPIDVHVLMETLSQLLC